MYYISLVLLLVSIQSITNQRTNVRTKERPSIMKPYQLSDDKIVSVKKKEGQLTVTIKHKDAEDKVIEFTPNR